LNKSCTRVEDELQAQECDEELNKIVFVSSIPCPQIAPRVRLPTCNLISRNPIVSLDHEILIYFDPIIDNDKVGSIRNFYLNLIKNGMDFGCLNDGALVGNFA